MVAQSITSKNSLLSKYQPGVRISALRTVTICLACSGTVLLLSAELEPTWQGERAGQVLSPDPCGPVRAWEAWGLVKV
jgi:hypothetical protein